MPTRTHKATKGARAAKPPARRHQAAHHSIAAAHPHTSGRAKFVAGYRIFYGLLALAAIIAQYARSTGHAAFNPVNFFSYFTIESNLLAAAAFLLGAWFIIARRPLPHWFNLFRGGVVVYMVLTGIIFALLLKDTSVQNDFSLLWADDVMHVVFPIIVAIDWLLVPPHRNITIRRAAVWLIFPVVWLAYTLWRGAVTGWYPYPFLVPDEGYLRVAGYCLVVASVIIVIGGLVKLVPAFPADHHAPGKTGRR